MNAPTAAILPRSASKRSAICHVCGADSMTRSLDTGNTAEPTPLWAVNALTFLASIGTGVVWNGVSFIAEHDYVFPKRLTLALYLVMGGTYVIGAISTGRVLRFVNTWLSPRSALGLILVFEAAVCTGPYFVHEDWMLWVVSCLISVLSSWLWPIVESYLTAGRHGAEMRRAIGWWNLCWTGAVATAMILMSPLVEQHARLAIVLLGGLHLVALAPLVCFGRFPGTHDRETSHASISPEYPFLLRAARLLLPLSYVLNSAMTPLLPYLMNNLNIEKKYQTIATSTWMILRIVAMAIMSQMGFWQGRWGTLLLGGVAMTAGFGLAVLGLSLPLLLIGLAVFGIGMGIVYYAALYYAMAVGHAEVDAGGTHEALIGVGYTIGPITGLVGVTTTGFLHENGWPQLWDGASVVVIVWILIALGAIGAWKPYMQARRRRTNPKAVAKH